MNVELNETEIKLIRNAIQTKVYALLKTAEDVGYPDVLTMRIKVVLDYIELDKKLTAILYHGNQPKGPQDDIEALREV